MSTTLIDDKVHRLLADAEAQRELVIEKEKELTTAILEAPDPGTAATARERDAAYDHQRHLVTQLRLLREGRLLQSPGVTFERLPELDARIAELKDRIARRT
jgi:hypothetical protein